MQIGLMRKEEEKEPRWTRYLGWCCLFLWLFEFASLILKVASHNTDWTILMNVLFVIGYPIFFWYNDLYRGPILGRMVCLLRGHDYCIDVGNFDFSKKSKDRFNGFKSNACYCDRCDKEWKINDEITLDEWFKKQAPV